MILTHNYDFFRTVINGLGVDRQYNSIAIKDKYGYTFLGDMPYQNDFFMKGVVQNIREGKLSSDSKKELLIVSIPFFRNIFEYTEENVKDSSSSYMFLTCCMHLKEKPKKTEEIMLSDIFTTEFSGKPFNAKDERYIDALFRIAGNIVKNAGEDLKLEDKFILSIYCRLEAEMYMKSTFPSVCVEDEKNQTRTWFNKVKDKLNPSETDIIERTLMISPAAIHMNSFMYEPLIDLSGWELVDLYKDINMLSNNKT